MYLWEGRDDLNLEEEKHNQKMIIVRVCVGRAVIVAIIIEFLKVTHGRRLSPLLI